MISYDDRTYNENIAILLATHNGEKYIIDQLESINAQSYQNFVCFIHDDMSTDSTVEIIQEYCFKHPGHFLFIGSDKCGGAKQNFMYMLNLFDADYVMFSDQDDVWIPSKIEMTLYEMERLENRQRKNIPLCVYSDVKIVDSSLMVLSEHFIGARGVQNTTIDLLKRNVIMGCTMMVNRILIDKMKNLKDIDNIYMHDWWGGLICSLLGELSYIEDPTLLYRQHTNNTIGATKKTSFLKKLRRVLSWKEWCNEKKEWIGRPRKMAKELITIIPKTHSNYDFLKKLAFIDKSNKISRIVFYIKNHMIIMTSNVICQLMFI